MSTSPIKPPKGRGASSNASGRYERFSYEMLEDDGGWHVDEDLLSPRPPTELSVDASKSIIARNTSPDVPTDRTLNPYRGCEHGCAYCFARPNHAHLGLSPGLDFETKLFWKPNAPDLLRKELSKKTYSPATIAIGSATDAYQPLEREKGLTRQILEVLCEARHPFSIITKNALVTRDIDLIGPAAQAGFASVALSVTSLDHKLSNKLEPRCSSPQNRLKAIRQLTEAGVPVTAMMSPLIPGLTDWEIERVVDAVAEAGARSARYILLRLPLEVAPLMEDWLETHAPTKKDKVLNLIREMRGGKLNSAEFVDRMKGKGVYADLMSKRFQKAARRHGLDLAPTQTRLNAALFRRPSPAGQLHLF